jgi:endonuclease/exonuclease/phosphatase (EEP) superfamily protein YafD
MMSHHFVNIMIRTFVILFALFCVSCDQPTPVPIDPNATDTTPPTIRVGSAGLRRDIVLTQDSTAVEQRRALSTADILILATANDGETGIRNVRLQGELRIVCIPNAGTQLVTIRDPIAEIASAPGGGTTLPAQLAKQYGLNVPTQRGRCPNATRFSELRLELTPLAENGIGQTRQLPNIIIESFGPDTLRVATFNVYNLGNHSDQVYEGWGQFLNNRVDVLMLTEIPDRRRAELLANAAGLPYVVMLQEGYYADVAIASRTPLRNVQRQVIDPDPSGGLDSAHSNILSAETDIRLYRHQIVSTHWGIRDANDVPADAWRSSPARLEAANAILALLNPPPAIAIVGGDLNAYSGIGPQRQPGATDEVAQLSRALTDPFVTLGIANELHCSDQRIDYIFVRGAYVPTSYEACFEEALPSDHPFVLVTLVAD